MELLWSASITGVVNGLVYALLSLGLALIFGVVRVVNFAHADFLTLGAYIVIALTALGVPLPIAMLIGVAAAFLLGIAFDRSVLKTIRAKALGDLETRSLVASIGLSLLITNAIFVIYGPDVRRTEGFFSGSVEVAGAIVSTQSIAAALIAVVAAVGLIWLLNSTKFGMAVRAVRDDPEYAGSFGVNRETIYGLSFAIAAGLAGLAGTLIAPVQYVSPYFGAIFLLKAFVIVVMAGLGSFVGVVVASLVLGVLESIAITQFGGHAGELVFFAVMCVTLLVRPNGLFGLKEKVA